MTSKVGVVRHNSALDEASSELQALAERAQKMCMDDHSTWNNQSLTYARQVQEMIGLGQIINRAARKRDECRGAHHKPDFELQIPEGKFPGDPEFEEYRKQWKVRNQQWLKTTIVDHTENGPSISYEDVDTSAVAPEQPRDYR